MAEPIRLADARPARPAAVDSIHARLRADILAGRLAPGAILSQVQLAREYGVSRTPMREALRMLHEEGLVHVEHNRRARVGRFDLSDLEAISAQRILLSAFATYLTVRRDQNGSLAGLTDLLAEMHEATATGDGERWRLANIAFHELHMASAPTLLRQDLRRLQERNHLYRAIWLRDNPHLDAQSDREHGLLLAACLAGDAVEAMHLIARHNARIAITVMTHAVPEREPVTIRTALQVALGDLDGERGRLDSVERLPGPLSFPDGTPDRDGPARLPRP